MSGLVADASGSLIVVAAGAVVAALGYVGRLIATEVMQARTALASRRTSLLRLQALLRAARTAYDVQAKLRDQLYEALKRNHPAEFTHANASSDGYEQLFSDLWRQPDLLDPDERELHLIIRGYTQHALRPVNEALLDWLRADSDYRNPRTRADQKANGLAVQLNQLDTHLMLWLAKYEVWIPDRPEHALNYANDEKQHGAAFPTGIDEGVEAMLKAQGIVVPVKRDEESGWGSR